uniref:G_PROTEIN_RECEP_F1_2 domain-containing protein n=1 Tax=Meloidogyne hapla TaxID=6305 RepID=A0A1I8BB97_MELHA
MEISSTISPNKTPLQELDSSTAINLLRYIIALNALFTNGFLIYLFARYKRYRALRGTQCNLFIAANAAVEFIIGIGLALRATFELIAMSMSIHSFTHSLCVWIGSPLTGGFAANQVTILGLALDRLTAVAWPFTYGKKNKNLIAAIFSFAAFIFFAAIGVSLWDVDPGNSSQCSMGVNAGPLFATTWSIYAQITALFVFGTYITMLCLFYRQSKVLALSMNKIKQQPKPGDNGVITRNINNKTSQEFQKTQKQIKVLDPKDLTRINYVTFIQGFITPLGAGINLYIYIWKHAEIRRSARDTIPFLKQILHDKTFTSPNT